MIITQSITVLIEITPKIYVCSPKKSQIPVSVPQIGRNLKKPQEISENLKLFFKIKRKLLQIQKNPKSYQVF